MTPGWLHKDSVITENYTLHPQYLELDHTTVINKPSGFQQAIQVKLVVSDILRGTNGVVATVTIAMDTKLVAKQ